MIPITLSDEQTTRVIAETHGVTATGLHRLGSEHATTLRVEAAGQATPLAVKVQGADSSTAPLQQWRSDVMQRLTELGHPIPTLLRDRAGSHITFTEVDGQPVAVQVMEWSKGLPYSEISVTPEFGLQLGSVAARLHPDLAELPPPPTPVTHAWDARDMAAQLNQQLTTLTDPEVRAATFEALALHRRFVEPVQDALPTCLVHQDLHDSNVLADHAGNITAVIDFDDMLVGWRIAEPAIAAGYLSRRVADPAAALEAVRSGWSETVPLTPAEAQAFGPLAAIRLALNAAVWANRLASDRGEYARERSRGSVAAFRALAECVA